METNENVILEEKRAKIAVERLGLEKIQMDNEIKALENTRNSLLERTKELNEELGKVMNDLNTAKTELKVVLEQITIAKMDMDSFTKTVESYRGEMSQLEEDIDEDFQVTEQDKKDEGDKKDGEDGGKAGHGVTVHAFGSTFDEKNRPSSKNISPEDEVSTKSWGSVNKTLVRKLAFLAGEGAHAYFGLVEGSEHPSQLKYPFAEVRKGHGTDIEFVVNVHGVETAYNFMVRKASGSEKKTIGGKLSAMYHKLVKLGHIKKVPDKLTKTAECTITSNITEPDWNDIFNILVLKSDVLDKVYESTDKTLSIDLDGSRFPSIYNDLFNQIKASSTNLSDSVKESFKAPFTKNPAYVTEQSGDEAAIDSKMQDMTMNMRGMYGFMCNKPYPYGEPLSEDDIGKYLGQNDLTEFAEKYGINSFNDFMVSCDTIKTNLAGEDLETGIAQIKDAVFMAGLKYLFSYTNPLSEDAVRGMFDVMGRAFDDLAECIANSDAIKATHKKMGGTEEKTSENSENLDKLPEIIQKDEKNNNKDLTEDKDMEVVEKVINMIKEKFETNEEVTPENLDVVVEKILARNDELEGELENIKLNTVREKTVTELVGLGYEEKAVKEIVAGCESEKELSKTLENMKKLGTKVAEKTETKVEEKKEETKVAEKTEEEGERKTQIEVTKKEESKESKVSDDENFKKILNEI